MTTLHVRLDHKHKRRAQNILKKLGMDLSHVVRLFVHQICITDGVPLQILTENGFSVDEEEAMLKDLNAARAKKNTKRYKTVDALLRSAYAHADHRHTASI